MGRLIDRKTKIFCFIFRDLHDVHGASLACASTVQRTPVAIPSRKVEGMGTIIIGTMSIIIADRVESCKYEDFILFPVIIIIPWCISKNTYSISPFPQ